MFYCIYFFVIGAFLGWILECVFKSLSGKTNNAPGILNGPFCILYGVGTVLLSTIIPTITDNTVSLFFISAIVLTICEYITYELLNKMYGIALWDYSDMALKINEKVCIEFSAIWGVLGTFYIKFMLPFLKGVFWGINGMWSNLILFAFLCAISLDLLYTNEKLITRNAL